MLHGDGVDPGAGARPRRAGTRRCGHRFLARGADRASRTPTTTKRVLRDAGQGHRRLRRAPRGDRRASSRRRRGRAAPGSMARGAARRSHRAGRMPGRLRRPVRAEFLDVPQECLILTMQQNQKYFPLLDARRQAAYRVPDLSQHAARRSARHRAAATSAWCARAWRMRVLLRPGQEDRLENARAAARRVVYHNKLGTQPSASSACGCWRSHIAARLEADFGLAERAALLCEGRPR